MNRSTDEFVAVALRISAIEFSKPNALGYKASDRLLYWPDDGLETHARGATLSMDEVRTSLDEFEQIIRGKLNFCSTHVNYTEAVVH